MTQGSERGAEYVMPSKEAVEHGRRTILAEVAKLKAWEAKAEAEGDDEKRRRMRFAAYMMERTLGHGCVIGAFDERWLDDEFRAAMAASVPWREAS